MVDALLKLLSLSPDLLLAVLVLGLVGGLGYIIYLLVQSRSTSQGNYAELTSNHLHELPAIADTLRRIEHSLHAASAAQLGQLADIRESLAYVKARIERRSDI